MNNGDTPAMPLEDTMNHRLEEGFFDIGIGLTKREYFAIHALQGILANPNELDVSAAAAALHEAKELLMVLQE